MELQRIRYDDLNKKQREVYNFQKVASLLAEYGYNCIKLADDWEGADFLAYHKDGQTLRVQQKGEGLSIYKKYCGKGLYITFRVRGHWYLARHDELVERLAKHQDTESWKSKGVWRIPKPSPELLAGLHRLGAQLDC